MNLKQIIFALFFFISLLNPISIRVINAESFESYLNNGREKLSDNDFQGALKEFNRVIEIDPQNWRAYHNRGLSKLELGKIEGALEDFTQAIELNQNPWAQSFFERGYLYQIQKKHKEAIADFTKSLELELIGSWAAFHNRGLSKSNLGEIEGALEDFTQAIKLNQNPWSQSYFERGIIYQKQKKHKKAIADFTKSLELELIDDWTAFHNRGLSKLILRDTQGALEDFTQAIELNQKPWAQTFYQRAYVYETLKAYKKAINDYSQAIELGIEDLDKELSYFFRGFSKYMLNDYKGAVNDYTKVIEINPNNIEAFNNRGLAEEKLGNIENAKLNYKLALKIDPKYKSSVINLRALSLSDQNNEISLWNEEIKNAELQKNYKKVIEIYSKIIEFEKKTDGINSFPYSAIAHNYWKMGDYKKAILFQKKAIKIEESITGKDSKEMAERLEALSVFYYKGQYFVDKETFNKVLEIKKNIVRIRDLTESENSLKRASAYQNLAALYAEKGEFYESIRLRKIAIKNAYSLYENPNLEESWFQPVPIYIAFLHSQIAKDYHSIGNHNKGKENDIKALDIRKQFLDFDDRTLADSYADVSTAYYYLGDLKASRENLDKALKILNLNKKENKFEIKSIERISDFLYAIDNNLNENKTKFKLKKTAVFDENISDSDPEAIFKLSLNASSLMMAKDYKEAIQYFQKAKNLLEEKRGKNNFQMVMLLNNLGSAYSLAGDLDNAEINLKESYEILKKFYNDARLSQEIIGIYNNLAYTYIKKNSLIKAQQFFRESIDSSILFVKEQAQFLPEEKRQNFSNYSFINSYAGIFSVIDLLPDGNKLALKYRINRHGLLEDIEKYQSRISNLDIKNKSLFKELENFNNELSDMTNTKEKRLEIKQKKISLEEKLYSKIPSLKTKIIELEEIKKALPKDALLIEFQKFRPFNEDFNNKDYFDEAKYIALILNEFGEVFYKDLGSAEVIEQKIYQALNSTEKGYSDAQDLFKEVGNHVIKPLKEIINKSDTLFISPDAVLNLLPFAALSSHNSEKLLGEAFDIRILTTGRELLDINKKIDKNFKKSLVIANPTFDLSRKVNEFQYSNESKNKSQQRSRYLKEKQWPQLPYTAIEGEAINKLIKGKLLTADNATSIAIQKESSPKVLHIATHAEFLGIEEEIENPLLKSYIVLAGANKPEINEDDDGYLTALEITKLDWSGTELVVISACESGKGEIQNGEGIYGLKRAIAVAGAKSSLLSLWKVDDRATSIFMESFYKKLLKGYGRADALAAVQDEFKNGKIKGYQHPYYWAAFQLNGDWRPINF